MTTASRPTTPLRQRIIEDMKIRNLSPHTIKAYVEQVAAFAKHFGKSPQLLGQKEVRGYLFFLVEEKRVSWSYYGQAICAIRFLYRVTLGKDWVVKARRSTPVLTTGVYAKTSLHDLAGAVEALPDLTPKSPVRENQSMQATGTDGQPMSSPLPIICPSEMTETAGMSRIQTG
jgi:hypothetical protein